jgi:uncharacterized membrane protein YkvA (DUF1232 family)
MATRNRIFTAPPFIIRITTPQELDAQTKKEVHAEYHSHIKHYTVRRKKISSVEFSKWKNQLGKSGGFKKQLVSVCDLLYKTYAGRNPIDLNLEARKQIVAALYYAFDPVDIIPDYVPETGYLDDVFCINLCLSQLKRSCPELWEEVKTLLERL